MLISFISFISTKNQFQINKIFIFKKVKNLVIWNILYLIIFRGTYLQTSLFILGKVD